MRGCFPTPSLEHGFFPVFKPQAARPPPWGTCLWNSPANSFLKQWLERLLCLPSLTGAPRPCGTAPDKVALRGPAAQRSESKLLPQQYSTFTYQTSLQLLQVTQLSSSGQNGRTVHSFISPRTLTSSSQWPGDMRCPGRGGITKSRSGTAILRRAWVQGQPSFWLVADPRDFRSVPLFPNK